MKFIDLIKLATRMFRARTSRTFLTILGIGIGMATILFLISLGFGVQKVILDRITTSDSLASIDVYSDNSEESRQVDWETIEKIGYIKEVEKTLPLLRYEGRVEMQDYSTVSNFSITEPGYIAMDAQRILAGGDLSSNLLKGVILTSSFVKVLDKEPEDLIGEKLGIILNIPEEEQGQFKEKQLGEDFEVIGVVESDKTNIFLNLENFSKDEYNQISLIKVKAENSNQVNQVKQQIKALGYKTSSVSEIVDQTRKFFALASLTLTILGVIALLVSSIGMFNTMVITLLERTEEIGIMKAIGATDRNILSIFVVEAALIGFLGGLAGIILGITAQCGVNFVFNFIAVRMGGEALVLFHSPAWFLTLLIGASLLIGILTGWIPAKKASKIDPLEALKYK